MTSMTVIDVWVQLHTGEPGVGLTKHQADTPKIRAETAVATIDPYGATDFGVRATWHHITGGFTHYTVWGGEDGKRNLAAGTLNNGKPVFTRDGELHIDSLQPDQRAYLAGLTVD